MDVKKIKPKKSKLPNKAIIAAVAGVVAVLYIALTGPSAGVESVNLNEIVLGTVKHGNLDVNIDGYGVLRSNKQRILIATSAATVAQVLLKPGAQVTAESIIVKLSNPSLEQQVLNAKQELKLREGDLRQLILTNQRDLLSEEATLADLKSQLAEVKLLRIANAELVKQGIVSSMELQKAQLKENQLTTRVEIQSRRYNQLKLVHKETLNNQQEKINQQTGSYNALNELVEQLTVRASMDGVLQELKVELGQGLLQGEQLAMISSTEDLVAMVKVPQTQIEQISIGQAAIIDTRRGEIQGKVVRIDPAVVEGTVTVEVQLFGEMPASARPALNIDAKILTDSLKDIFYVENPINSRADTVNTLFKMNQAKDQADAVRVSLGTQAGRYIQVVAGAKKGDVLILSDMSNNKGKKQLHIIQ